jgi:hypothetical protein
MKTSFKAFLLLYLVMSQQIITVYGVSEGEQINTEEEELKSLSEEQME